MNSKIINSKLNTLWFKLIQNFKSKINSLEPVFSSSGFEKCPHASSDSFPQIWTRCTNFNPA